MSRYRPLYEKTAEVKQSSALIPRRKMVSRRTDFVVEQWCQEFNTPIWSHSRHGVQNKLRALLSGWSGSGPCSRPRTALVPMRSLKIEIYSNPRRPPRKRCHNTGQNGGRKDAHHMCLDRLQDIGTRRPSGARSVDGVSPPAPLHAKDGFLPGHRSCPLAIPLQRRRALMRMWHGMARHGMACSAMHPDNPLKPPAMALALETLQARSRVQASSLAALIAGAMHHF